MMRETPPCAGSASRERRSSAAAWPLREDRRRLVVGLVNNVGEAAMAATQRQFRDLIQAAVPGRTVEMRVFHLDGVARSPEAMAAIEATAAPAETATRAGLDALVVTGAEPAAADLSDEPFFGALARLADAAETAGTPVLWSCLAAHAAVLRQAGLRRHALPAKLSGVYAVTPLVGDVLLEDMGAAWTTPHSRWNGLDAGDLAEAGYRVLGGSRRVCVDAFARRSAGGALQLFLQGHPEYDRTALAREFRRDLDRFVDGSAAVPPALPGGVFSPAGEAAMRARLDVAATSAGRRRLSPWPAWNALGLKSESWRPAAAALIRNWLSDARPDRAVERRAVSRPGLESVGAAGPGLR